MLEGLQLNAELWLKGTEWSYLKYTGCEGDNCNKFEIDSDSFLNGFLIVFVVLNIHGRQLFI